jgi:hypothetical protein
MLPRSLLVSNKIAAIDASTLADFVTTKSFTPTPARCSDRPTHSFALLEDLIIVKSGKIQ